MAAQILGSYIHYYKRVKVIKSSVPCVRMYSFSVSHTGVTIYLAHVLRQMPFLMQPLKAWGFSVFDRWPVGVASQTADPSQRAITPPTHPCMPCVSY